MKKGQYFYNRQGTYHHIPESQTPKKHIVKSPFYKAHKNLISLYFQGTWAHLCPFLSLQRLMESVQLYLQGRDVTGIELQNNLFRITFLNRNGELFPKAPKANDPK